MKKIIALNGSLRQESSNGKLLNSIEEILSDLNVSIYENLGVLPHFNPDLEMPEVVLEFKRKINNADYLLIVTPEYAHGIPGVLKNALDWLVSDEELPHKEVILFVCSAGAGEHALNSLVEICRTMSLNVLDHRCFSVSGIRSKFKDDKLDKTVEKKIIELAQNL